jgi:hypothetical protein
VDSSLKAVLSWRGAVIAGYVAWTLVCAFVFGGGVFALLFFGVWGAVWLGFSLWWRWADNTRQALLRRRGYY